MKKRTIVIVPARMASSRFPGKPLVPILGLPMIEHIRRRAMLAEGVDEVVVATCDEEIAETVRRFGGEAVMTADTHERSSERVAEAMGSLAGDVVVVAQGDEPLLLPSEVSLVAAPLQTRDDLTSVSLLSPLERDDFNNPNVVKAVLSQMGNVIYYSRAPIPYFQKQGECPVFRETGLRSFTADFLLQYTELPETPFERVEGVDMMRLIENDFKVFGVTIDYATRGVDHPEEVAPIEKILREDDNQRALYEEILRL